MYGTSGGERMKPGVLRSACTIDDLACAMFGQAYSRVVVVGAGDLVVVGRGW